MVPATVLRSLAISSPLSERSPGLEEHEASLTIQVLLQREQASGVARFGRAEPRADQRRRWRVRPWYRSISIHAAMVPYRCPASPLVMRGGCVMVSAWMKAYGMPTTGWA